MLTLHASMTPLPRQSDEDTTVTRGRREERTVGDDGEQAVVQEGEPHVRGCHEVVYNLSIERCVGGVGVSVNMRGLQVSPCVHY